MTQDAHKSYRLSGGAADALELRNDGFEEQVERQWFSPKIDRKQLKQLMQRSDSAGLRHFGSWLVLLVASGSTAYATWGTLLCLPAFAVYGVLYAMSDHHAHELSHGTPFRTLPDGQSQGALVAAMLPAGAHYVKAFGTLAAGSLADSANRAPRRVALFYATDDNLAGAAIERLITVSGFDPVKVGFLTAGYGGFTFDTDPAIPGNSNAGHEYGTRDGKDSPNTNTIAD